jgi:SAM-dependent methyltransferase
LADLNRPLPLEADSFDLAVILDVIEHIPLADDLLLECGRVLKNGGLLLLSTPNVAWVLYRVQALMGRPPPGEGYHYRFFAAAHLAHLLDQAGFEIVRKNSWTYPLPGLNRLRKRFGYPRVDWRVPVVAERLWAHSLVWLAENKKRALTRPRKVWEKPLNA